VGLCNVILMVLLRLFHAEIGLATALRFRVQAQLLALHQVRDLSDSLNISSSRRHNASSELPRLEQGLLIYAAYVGDSYGVVEQYFECCSVVPIQHHVSSLSVLAQRLIILSWKYPRILPDAEVSSFDFVSIVRPHAVLYCDRYRTEILSLNGPSCDIKSMCLHSWGADDCLLVNQRCIYCITKILVWIIALFQNRKLLSEPGSYHEMTET